MRIDTLCINNFRSVDEATLNFDGHSVVLFGINGCGKTSILHAIALIYSNIINRVVKRRYEQERKFNIELNDVRIGTSKCKIELDFNFLDKTYHYGRTMNKQGKVMRKHVNMRDLEAFSTHFESLLEESTEQQVDIPIFVNYGVNRLVLDIPLRIRKTHVFDPLYTYENAIQSTVAFRTFFEWYRNREDYENELIREDRDYEDRHLKAVRTAIGAMLNGFSGLCVKRNPLAMMIKKNNVLLNVTQLSDGEKCTLALVGDLARRISMANPSLENPLGGNGVVLIDEIELHLHPQWQRKIIPTLRDIFPNVQFIVSTHSPQVLNDVMEDMKVYALRQEDGRLRISELRSLNGWDINSILENNMDTPSQQINTRKLINDIYRLIEEGDYKKASEFTELLQSKTNGTNPTVIELQFLIDRGMRKHEKN